MGIDDIEDESNLHGCCAKNKLSICLAFIVMLLTVALFCLLFFFFLGYIQNTGNECTEPACIKASFQIKNSIDTSIDPCEDFQAFVCKKFEKFAYENQINNLWIAERDKIIRHLETHIVEPVDPDDPQPVKMQKTYFQTCLNEAEIDEDGDQTLLKKLQEVGEWPLLRKHNNWNDQNFDWTHVMIKTRDLGLHFQWFLKVDLYSDQENYQLKLSQPDNCGDKFTDEYFAMQRDILEKLTRTGIETISEFAHLEQFERQLNLICVNQSNADIELRRVLHLRLENVTKNVEFLKALTGLTHHWRPESTIAFNMDYIYQLNRLLKVTPKKVQANYILWKIVEYFAPHLSESIRERYGEYMSETSDTDMNRFQFCLEDTKTKFKFVSEVVELQRYFDSSIEEKGKELVEAIKNEIVTHIDNVEWRSNKTKETHLNFYDNVGEIIGGTEKMFEDTFLSNEIDVGKLMFIFDNNVIQMITDWARSVFFSKMRKIGSEVTFELDLVYKANSKTEIVLDDVEQLITVPISVLDSFLYDVDYPQYLNYAGLGTMIGKELVRGLRLLTKPRHESYKGFEENKKCLIESLQKSNVRTEKDNFVEKFSSQYQKHFNASFLFLNIYESLVAQELAYRAYQTYVTENGEEQQLLNLPYTPNQLFWIKSSLNWCHYSLPEDDISDNDENFKYTIIETVKNSVSFATDFNCSVDAPMNPINKCQLL